MTYKLTNTSQPADPYYGAVSLLLHGDGADGSTEILDSSSDPKTVTAVGDAQISTTQSKFNGSSLKFDGSGDSLQLPHNADFSLGSEDFTIEFWLLTNQNNIGAPVAHRSAAGAGATNWLVTLNYPTQDKLALYLSDGSSYVVNGLITTSSVNDGQWHHYAATRSGSSVRVFVDGILENTATTISSVSSTARILQIGNDEDGNYLNGYIDDLRITKGVARYTSNFTPPTQPFLSTSNIVINGLVLNLDAASYAGSGTTWSDLSRNENNGTLVNGVGYDSGNGGSLTFDPTLDQYVSFTSASQTSLQSQQISLCCWIKSVPYASFYNLFGWSSYGLAGGILLDINSSGGTVVPLLSAGNGAWTVVNSNINLGTSIGYVVGTYDGSSLKIYINGVLANSVNAAITIGYSGRELALGRYGFSNLNDYSGNIYSASMYNRALTAAEVLQNYNALKGRFGL